MAGLNSSASYEFDPGISGGPRSGGLLGMLQRAMQEQNLQQQRADYTAQPGASAVGGSDAPPGGLLGRLLAFQAAQRQPESFGRGSGQIPSAPADPNFRRLVRVSPAVQSQGGIADSALGDGILPDVLPTSYQGSGESGADAERPAPVIAGFPRIGRASPVPPMGPMPLPPLSLPPIPDWLKVVGRILQFDPRTWSGGGGNDDYRRCIRAAGGSTEQWEEFCRSLGQGQNNTLGGESQKRACWSKTYETETNKREWCGNQFGDD